jgi:hypothetical protein
MLHDLYYYAARAAEERRNAMASANLKVRAVHLEMAAYYDALVLSERSKALGWSRRSPRPTTPI